MKRRRDSTACNAKRRRNRARKGKTSRIQIDYSGYSFFVDLPDNILVTILLCLSVKSIFVCKCVCKTWYDLISDPDFAKLHFNQGQVYPLLRTSGFTLLSRMLYLVQPDQDDFQRMLRYDYKSPINKIKLDFKMKLPLRNIQMILDKDRVDGVDIKNCIMKQNMIDHKYNIVNSCNGLLCLSNPSNNKPDIVCNPVTGELINLPDVSKGFGSSKFQCGFGFSPVTNQYKVIRMFMRCTGPPNFEDITVAEVHTLGTETWRVLPSLPEPTYVRLPTYLDGRVYWLDYNYIQKYSVKSFDVEKECIESISVPWNRCNLNHVSIGVLGEELFISAFLLGDNYILRFWVMKDNGANKTWSQIYLFDQRLPYITYQPIMYLNNGSLLMFNSDERALIYKDTRKSTGFRYFKVRGFDSGVEVIAHIPSFVPLKHALSGHDVEVLNVNSRCAELKLHREGKVISLVEEVCECST